MENLPPITKVLAAIPQEALYHELIGRRAPLAVYNVAVQELWSRLQKVIRCLESMSKYKLPESDQTAIPGLPDMPDTLENYRELLYSLMEYLEDCKGILRSLFKSADAFKKNPYVRNYEAEIEQYRDYVGNIVNKIKHNQARLRGVFLYNEDLFVPGFYVEKAIDGDTVGPDSDIHEGGATAISFYRDIRYHFVEVLLSSDSLALAARDIMGISPSGEQGGPNEGELSGVNSLADRISQLPLTCFINEVGKDEPFVLALQKSVKDPEFVIGYGPATWKFKTFLDFKISVQSMGDGVTRSFKFPYFGNDCAIMIEKHLIEVKRRLRYIPKKNWPFLDLAEEATT
jgi:hypothetical protein